MPYVSPADGEVVGVGEPVAIRFDENIANRAAAQRAITITTNPPVEGAFYWLNNREVRWRPEHFWKSGTVIDVAVNTYGWTWATVCSARTTSRRTSPLATR